MAVACGEVRALPEHMSCVTHCVHYTDPRSNESRTPRYVGDVGHAISQSAAGLSVHSLTMGILLRAVDLVKFIKAPYTCFQLTNYIIGRLLAFLHKLAFGT